MTHLMIPVLIGVVVSLVVFLFFERRAIAAKRASEKSLTASQDLTLPENLKRYDTDRNVLFYTLSMFIFTLFYSNIMFFSKELTLVDVFLYIFLTTFVGSLLTSPIPTTSKPIKSQNKAMKNNSPNCSA